MPHNDYQEAFDFDDVASAGTGLSAPDDRSEYEIARALLIRQSAEIEHRLGRIGIDMRPKASTANTVSVGNVTGVVEQSERQFRKCRFLPVVAKADRASWIREVEYFLRHDPKGSFARYGVITCGPREEFGDGFVDRSKKAIARTESNIRRWINESRDQYGIDVILKTLEAATNQQSSHNHFNAVYIPRRKLKKGEFGQWLAFSRRRLASHWKDCGRIRDIREVIKYACKITGQDSLETLDDAAFGSMFDLLHGKTTIQAHGSFAEFRKRLETEKKKVVWMRKANAPPFLVIMRKQTKTRTPGPKPVDELKENLIIGRQLPRAMGTGLLEPVTIVQNYCENPTTSEGKRRLAVLQGHIEQATKWAARNGADVSAYKVHTNTASVQTLHTERDVSIPPEAETAASGGAGLSGDSQTVRAAIPCSLIPSRHDPLKGRLKAEPPRPRIKATKQAEQKPLIPSRYDPLRGRLRAEPPRRPIMERGPDGEWREAKRARRSEALRRLPPVRSFRPIGGG